jgi:hypothetical protein
MTAVFKMQNIKLMNAFSKSESPFHSGGFQPTKYLIMKVVYNRKISILWWWHLTCNQCHGGGGGLQHLNIFMIYTGDITVSKKIAKEPSPTRNLKKAELAM